MGRRPLIAGNWKMHMTLGESEQLAAAVVQAAAGFSDREVMVAPPYTALATVAKVVAGSTVRLASQNIHWQEKGAYTGEISPVLLKDVGVTMALVGHSERRHVFHEDDVMVNQRLKGAMQYGLVPVLCVGESLAEREQNRTMAVLEGQVRAGLDGVVIDDPLSLVVAYEPVWAIGTGKTATEGQAQEVHHFVRQLLGQLFEKNIADQVRILYGGSVKPDNINILMAQPDIDGALVGGAALTADSFARLIAFT